MNLCDGKPSVSCLKSARCFSERRFDGLGTQGPFRWPLFRLQRRALPVEDIKNPLRFLLEKMHVHFTAMEKNLRS